MVLRRERGDQRQAEPERQAKPSPRKARRSAAVLLLHLKFFQSILTLGFEQGTRSGFRKKRKRSFCTNLVQYKSPLESTLIEVPASVDSKPLTETLSLLDATGSKNPGRK